MNSIQSMKFKSIAISLFLIGAYNPYLFAVNNTSAKKLDTCTATLNSDQETANDTLLQLKISYDTEKVGGKAEQVNVYELLAKQSALDHAIGFVHEILDQQIKPAMSEMLLGKDEVIIAADLNNGLNKKN